MKFNNFLKLLVKYLKNTRARNKFTKPEEINFLKKILVFHKFLSKERKKPKELKDFLKFKNRKNLKKINFK